METIGRDLREMQRVPLAPAHVAALERAGAGRRYRSGEMLTEVGAPIDRFIYVVSGEVEVADPFTGERLVPSTIGPAQFVGEIALLAGGTWSLPMRAARDTEVIEVPRADMLRLMAAIPEMSDIVVTVLAARTSSSAARCRR